MRLFFNRQFRFVNLVCVGCLWACVPINSDGSVSSRTVDTSDDTDSHAIKSCEEDFDCNASERCVERLCTDAGNDDRTFGRETFAFSGDVDERHLLVVYSLPQSEAVSADFVSYELKNANETSLGGTLSLGRSVAYRSPITNSLLRRIDFEAARRRRLDALIIDLQAGRRTLWPAQGRDTHVCAPACADTQMCWQGSCVDEGTQDLSLSMNQVSDFKVEYVKTLSSADMLVNVLVDQSQNTLKQSAVDAATKFLSTFQDELRFLGLNGHDSALDRNQDGRLHLVFSRQGDLELNTLGYFDFRDFLPATDADASGNEADILWARIPSANDSVDGIAGTLAHEYTHLASYAQRVEAKNNAALREVLWLDEGLAHLMEDLTGWSGSNIPIVETALSDWDTAGFAIGTTNDSATELVVRGQAYLFLRHLIDQKSDDGNANSTATQAAAASIVSELINEEAIGFEHAIFTQGVTDSSIAHWLQAVYASGRDDLAESAHRFDYLPLGTSTLTENNVGIATTGDFQDDKGEIITLEGPPTEELLDELPVDSLELISSGSQFFELSGFSAGSLEIVGRAAPGQDLRMFSLKVSP
jgi:hypothetical protein